MTQNLLFVVFDIIDIMPFIDANEKYVNGINLDAVVLYGYVIFLMSHGCSLSDLFNKLYLYLHIF